VRPAGSNTVVAEAPGYGFGFKTGTVPVSGSSAPVVIPLHKVVAESILIRLDWGCRRLTWTRTSRARTGPVGASTATGRQDADRVRQPRRRRCHVVRAGDNYHQPRHFGIVRRRRLPLLGTRLHDDNLRRLQRERHGLRRRCAGEREPARDLSRFERGRRSGGPIFGTSPTSPSTRAATSR
jgi:hypothetical protein